MFQQWFVELVSLLSEICVGISAAIVAIVAIIGITQWKVQMRGRDKYEITKKLMILILEFRDKYNTARNPQTFPDEYGKIEKSGNETSEESSNLDEWYARKRRLGPLQETLRNLYVAGREAEALFDNNIRSDVRQLESIFGELHSSIDVYFSYKDKRYKNKQPTDNLEDWIHEHYQRIYQRTDDELTKNINEITQKMIARLVVHLK